MMLRTVIALSVCVCVWHCVCLYGFAKHASKRHILPPLGIQRWTRCEKHCSKTGFQPWVLVTSGLSFFLNHLKQPLICKNYIETMFKKIQV